MNCKLTFTLACVFVLTLLVSFSRPSSKSKSRYIDNYVSMGNLYRRGDTVSAALYLTQDSFAIIYQIRVDSDYRLPLLQGTWSVVNDTLLDFKYENSVMKGAFEMDEFAKYITIDGFKFSQHIHMR